MVTAIYICAWWWIRSWRKYPKSVLVMSGMQSVTEPARSLTRQGELSRDRTTSQGVPVR